MSGQYNVTSKAPAPASAPAKNVQIKNAQQNKLENKIDAYMTKLGDENETTRNSAANDLAKLAKSSSPDVQQMIADKIIEKMKTGNFADQMGAANVAYQFTFFQAGIDPGEIKPDVLQSLINPLSDLLGNNNHRMGSAAHYNAANALNNITNISGISPGSKALMIDSLIQAARNPAENIDFQNITPDEPSDVRGVALGTLAKLIESPNILKADKTKALNSLVMLWASNNDSRGTLQTPQTSLMLDIAGKKEAAQASLTNTLKDIAASPNLESSLQKILAQKLPSELLPQNLQVLKTSLQSNNNLAGIM